MTRDTLTHKRKIQGGNVADRETKSRRESPGLQRRKLPDSAGRHSGAARPLLNDAAKTDAAERESKAAAEALVLLNRIVVAESARRASQTLRAAKENPFEAWYLRACEREKARRKSKKQEAAFGLAVATAALVELAYLWGTWFAFHRFASGWELLPLLFGGVIAFSFLFYKILGRRSKIS